MHRRPHRTAQLIGVRVAVVLWRDDGYGLIDRKQADESGRRFLVRFDNPDLLEDAQSFGVVAFRPESVAGLHAAPSARCRQRLTGGCDIAYTENVLMQRLGQLAQGA